MDFENPGQTRRGVSEGRGEGFSFLLVAHGFSPRTCSSLLLRSGSFLVHDKAAAKICRRATPQILAGIMCLLLEPYISL